MHGKGYYYYSALVHSWCGGRKEKNDFVSCFLL